MHKPDIIISTDDLERLEGLLSQPAARNRRDLDGLRAELDRADIRSPEDMPDDVIRMESCARFQDLESGREYRLTLSYPGGADPARDRISVFTPAGSALLGLSVGQTIAWPTADGHVSRLKVLQVGSVEQACAQAQQ